MAKKQNKTEEVSPLKLEDIFAPLTELEKKAAMLVPIAQKQMQTSVKYKEQRMQEIQKSIDLYNGKTKKALKGRWNVPLPMMSGYVDTLLSKTDDAPRVKFGYQDVADMERASKVQAKWDQDSNDPNNMWALKDRMEKKMASFYGYGISKIFAYNDEKGMYRSVYEVVDPLDFECEPMGGQIIGHHKYKGQRNIFKTKSDLVQGANGDKPVYNRRQVLKLIATLQSDTKEIEKIYTEKTDRLRALGFAPDTYNYVGVQTYNMTEWYMEDPETGVWYYMLIEPHTGIWVRCEKLKDVFKFGEDPFTVWHTHPDPFNFYSKSPADDIRPIAEGMNVIFNQALDNREKKNYAQRAYDPEIFPDPAQLEWRPDGLVEATTSSGERPIGAGIYQFSVADMPERGTIDLMQFMDNLSGTKSGVTNSAQGATDEKKVGIYFGDLQQVADRLGLYNKSYSEAYGRKGRLYYFGLREHIQSNKLMVRMIGSKGYNWVELVKEDLYPTHDFNIEIVGGQAQAQLDEISKKTKIEALKLLMANPNIAPKLNPEVTIEETLRAGGWEEGQIRRFMDVNSYGSEMTVSKAHQAIEQILEGKQPKQNRGADTLFMQTIVDFAYDADDLNDETFQALISYADGHTDIATENAVRKARSQAGMMEARAAMAGIGAPMGKIGQSGGVPMVPGEPALTPGGAKEAVQSKEMANIMNP